MSIRLRLIAVFIFAIFLGFLLIYWWVINEVTRSYNESFEEVLVDTANIMAEIVGNEVDFAIPQLRNALQGVYQRKLSAHIYLLEKTNIDLRIYITDVKGIVLFDSQDGKSEGQDFSQWRDVKLTLEGKYGARATPSDPKGDSLVDKTDNLVTPEVSTAYIAAPIYAEGKIIGVLSVGKPKTNMDKFIYNAKYQFTLALTLAIGAAILFAVLLSLWVSRPLLLLTQYAEKVKNEEKTPLPNLGNNEMGDVGRAMESMRESLQDKHYVEQYVQTLTHELKSPLTGIQAAAELLREPMPAEKRQQFSDNIIRETKRLNDFTNRLLALTALEKSQKLEQKTTIEIEPLCNAIIKASEPERAQQNISISTQYLPQLTVLADRFLLRQAIDNLLRNAIDFSPPNSTISVTIEHLHDQYGIRICDQGPGIPEYAKSRIFERFYSLARPGTNIKSSGLGLNFVKEVAQLHGGEISLNSNSQGTCATLTLEK